LQVRGQTLAAFAHPADPAGGIAGHEGVVGDVLRHHGAGADEGVAADGVAADDGAVGPQGGAALDEGGAYLVHLADLGPGVVDVREDHGGAAEDAVFEGDAFIDGDVVLDLAAGADDGIRADDDVLADVAVLADSRTTQNIRKMPDFTAAQAVG